MKKNFSYLLLLSSLLFMLPLCSIFSQEVDLRKMDEVTRTQYLTQLAKEVTKNFGPGYYRKDSKPVITEGVFQTKYDNEIYTKHIGREYYVVKFPYDTKKELLEWDYTSKVDIWKDTGEPLLVTFGNGMGKHFFCLSYKEWLELGIEKEDSIIYQQVKLDTRSIWKEE